MQNLRTELDRTAELEISSVLDDFSWLAERIGSISGFDNLSSAGANVPVPRVEDGRSLAVFVEFYRTQFLLGWELPSVYEGFRRVERFEIRELILLDHQLSSQWVWTPFSEASQRIGRSQLQRLRPLRDHRGVQRYAQAVENGEAKGWHTLVYGLMLALYSLPLRQGLCHYASKTLGSLVKSAAKSIRLSNSARQQLLQRVCQPVPEIVDSILSRDSAIRPLSARNGKNGSG